MQLSNGQVLSTNKKKTLQSCLAHRQLSPLRGLEQEGSGGTAGEGWVEGQGHPGEMIVLTSPVSVHAQKLWNFKLDWDDATLTICPRWPQSYLSSLFFVIQALRDLVVAEENLVCSTRDEFLIKFLRAKKFDYEKSFKMVQRYCAMRSRSPQNFLKSLPSLAKDTLDCQLQNVLSHRDSLARRVFIFRVGKWNTATTTPEEIFRDFVQILNFLRIFPPNSISYWRLFFNCV